jgi:hypothetical protein
MLDVPTSRHIDSATLEQFREVDPTIEILYLSRGNWAVGSVSLPLSKDRFNQALMICQQELGRSRGARGGDRYKVGLAAMQGFKMISKYTDRSLQNRFAIKEFRYTDFQYRKNREAAFEEAYWHAAGGGSAKDREDELRSEAVYRAQQTFRTLFKKPIYSYNK